MDRLTLDDFMEVLEQAHRYDHYVSGLCPLPDHDDRLPSLLVFDDGRYLCLGCGAKGWADEIYNLVIKRPRRATPETTYYPPSIPTDNLDKFVMDAHDRLVESEGSLGWYLRERKVDGMIDSAYLGWYDGWYTIPIFDGIELPELRGVMLRASPSVERQSNQRFIQPAGQRPMLYMPKYMSQKKRLFVVFGMFDALSVATVNLLVCTSTGGKDSFNPQWLDWWRGTVVVAPDAEEEDAGHKLVCSLAMGRGILHRIDYPRGCKDPNDILKAKGERGLLAALSPWIE